MYKTKLPFVLVFNKTDVQSHDFAVGWMQDFEAFQAALASHRDTNDEDGEPTYMNSLMNSMSLVLDEFYKNLKVSRRFTSLIIGTLRTTGSRGFECDWRRNQGVLRCSRCLAGRIRKVREHVASLQLAFTSSREYLPELERARAARDKSLQNIKDDSMARLEKDLAADKQRNPALNETWEEEVDEDGEDEVVDRCKLPSRISKPGALLHGTFV